MSVIRLSIRQILSRNLIANKNNEMVKKLVINLSSTQNLFKPSARNYSAITNRHVSFIFVCFYFNFFTFNRYICVNS